jgi:hypothetical protein
LLTKAAVWQPAAEPLGEKRYLRNREVGADAALTGGPQNRVANVAGLRIGVTASRKRTA